MDTMTHADITKQPLWLLHQRLPQAGSTNKK